MSQEQAGQTNWQTLEEAYEALPEIIQKHSIRVAEYMEVLYSAALEIGIDIQDKDVSQELDEQYIEAICHAGRYHEIGLAALSEEMQKQYVQDLYAGEKEFPDHVTQGVAIAEELRQREGEISPERAGYWQIIIEGIRCHHERPDGAGYPQRLQGREIPMAAWFASLADCLDKFTAFCHQEKPFEKGFEKMTRWMEANIPEEEEGTSVMTEMGYIFKFSRSKLQRVFRRHQEETRIIEYRTPLLKYRSTRPMCLQYRPVKKLRSGTLTALDCKPVFRMKKEYLELEEVLPELQKQKAVPDIWRYFLYEASDMTERITAHGMKTTALRIPLPKAVASQAKTVTTVRTWLKETEVSPDRIIFVLEETALARPGKTFLSTLEKIKTEGIHLAVSDYTGTVQEEQLKACGIESITLSPTLLDHIDAEKKEQLKALTEAGYELLADGIEDESYTGELAAMQIRTVMGAWAGDYQDADSFLG